MARPVRELWKTLGAAASDAADVLVVDASALCLESLFGGALEGEATVRLFSEEAFGFTAPDELAALGVFWAPHLEQPEQLRAAVRDAQDRLQRKLDEDSRTLEGVGLEPRLEGPHARCRATADIGGHEVTVALGPGGELLLEVVDGGEIEKSDQELFRTLANASRPDVEDRIAERAHELLETGRVVAVTRELDDPVDDALDGGAGFDDDDATRQLPAVERDDVDPGTELVPPPDDDDELSASARSALQAALADDDDFLADSLEGAAVSLSGDALEEDFERPVTASARRGDTAAPDSFMDLPAHPTEQISVVPPDGHSGDESATGFDETTGEERLVASLSGEDGVMPSPEEATALRPAPTSAELGLDGADEDEGDEAPEAEEEEERTLARAPLFRPGRKGPSLVSSGNAGSSVDDEKDQAEASLESADDLDAVAARALEHDREGAASELQDVALHDVDEDEDPEDVEDDEDASTLRPGQLFREGLAAGSDDSPVDDELTLQGTGVALEPVEDAPSSDALERLDAEPTDPSRSGPGVDERRDSLDPAAPSLDLDVEVVAASQDPLDGLAAIVGEGISSGKTGAIVLDADAFAQLRGLAGETALSDDPEALEREADLLESRARELRGRAALLRDRSTVPVSRRHLAERLQRERASRDEEPLLSAAPLSGEDAFSSTGAFEESVEAPVQTLSRSDAGAFADGDGGPLDDAAADAGASSAAPLDEAAGGGDMDAFADGVALDEVRAMLASERSATPDLYAATQLAEMDLGDLRQPSHSGGDVFGDGGSDAAYDLDDQTGRGTAYPRSSLDSLPQVASSDVHALGSMAQLDADDGGASGDLSPPTPTRGSGSSAVAPPAGGRPSATHEVGTRALALVVSDPRARERLRKHLEETFPRVVELASAADAVTLSERDVQAVVIVRPAHDDATVSGLKALEGKGGRPPVLVLSSDTVFDGLPGVDLRLALGRRASEVARQVLEGLETLGVEASV